MPLVQVKLIEGVFSDPQKQEMIRSLSDAMVSIEGEKMRNEGLSAHRSSVDVRLDDPHPAG
jgi:phenylpyruvate tautomerase PptA (4-oxalocrotonate tautomerase family)